MRKNVVSLLIVLGGFLTAYIGLFTPANIYFLNYHEMNITEWFYFGTIIGLELYALGISTAAVVLQKMSLQQSEIEPSFLVLGGIIGLLVGSLPIFINLLTQRSYPIIPLLILPISFLLSILGIRIACDFPRRKSNSHQKILLFRTLIPSVAVLLALTVIWINNSSFPGVTAVSVVREEWAYKEFNQYKGVVDTIKNCQPIIKRVGNVKFVAPTQGRNYVVSDPGSSGSLRGIYFGSSWLQR